MVALNTTFGVHLLNLRWGWMIPKTQSTHPSIHPSFPKGCPNVTGILILGLSYTSSTPHCGPCSVICGQMKLWVFVTTVDKSNVCRFFFPCFVNISTLFAHRFIKAFKVHTYMCKSVIVLQSASNDIMEAQAYARLCQTFFSLFLFNISCDYIECDTLRNYEMLYLCIVDLILYQQLLNWLFGHHI